MCNKILIPATEVGSVDVAERSGDGQSRHKQAQVVDVWEITRRMCKTLHFSQGFR